MQSITALFPRPASLRRRGWIFFFCAALAGLLGPTQRLAAQVSLTMPSPIEIPAGPLGSWGLSGVVSYAGFATPDQYGAEKNGGDLTNGFAILQKTTGQWQFFVMAGGYAYPALGAGRLTTTQYSQFLGLVPEAYAEYVFNPHWSIEAGKLPTLIGQESTWSYLNYNIQRGLVWNDMENLVSRAAQLNMTYGKWTVNLQYGDGFYAGYHFGAPSAAIAYAINAKNTFTFVALIPNKNTPPNGTFFDANAQLYDFMYTYTGKNWSWTPYVIFMDSPASTARGYTSAAHGMGYVLLGGYRINPEWILGMRAEYATTNGSLASTSANMNILGYGPGAKAATFTLTPTWQDKDLFARGEFSLVHAMDYAPGAVFGKGGAGANEFRGAAEIGVAF